MPDTITAPTGAQLDDAVAENIAALSPCPVCGSNALEGPEGWAWSHLPHCWKCGYNWKKPAPTSVNAPAVPSLAPAQVQSLAAAVVEQLKQSGWSPPQQSAPAIDATATDTTGGEAA